MSAPHVPVVAAVVAAPLMLAGAVVDILLASLAGVNLVWSEPALTLSEAAALNDRGTIARLVRDGVDINRPAPVRAGVIVDTTVVATPLEASVATRTPTTMQFLVSLGARMDERERTVVRCTATRIEAEEIVQYLRDTIGTAEIDGIDCTDVPTPW